MNYDEARQLKDGGWHWTTMNNGVVRTASPCIQVPEVNLFDEALLAANITRCDPHPTREDAERHFYDYSLSQLKETTTTHAQRCEVCDTWTNKALCNKGEWLYFGYIFLCDNHRQPSHVEALRPFSPCIAVIHS